MFGSKKDKDNIPNIEVDVDSMPAEFYGGVNPVVKFKVTEREVEQKSQSILTVPEKKAWDKGTAVGGASKLHAANLLTSPKFLLLSAAGLFVVFGAVAGFYYWQQARKAQIIVPPVENVAITPPVVEPVVETPPVTEVVVEPVVTTTPVMEEAKKSLLDTPPEYPSMTLGESNDTDKDGLSDVAEELFTTDLGAPDTDKDKYLDGHEIYNLYNPIGKEPLKLLDSDLVLDFVNPIFGYKTYYPKSWAVGNVDVNYRSVLFSTLSGENIEVRAIEKNSPNGSFADWFAQWAPTERMNDLKSFTTVFKDNGWQRSDEMVYYFDTPNRVYVLIYHTTDSAVVNYKIVLKMMARSFRLPLTNEILPLPIVEDSGTGANEENTNIASPVPDNAAVPTTSASSSGI